MGNRRTMTQAASGSLIEYGLERFFRTDVPLRFQDEDLLRYPWLNDRDRYYYFERKLGGGGLPSLIRVGPATRTESGFRIVPTSC